MYLALTRFGQANRNIWACLMSKLWVSLRRYLWAYLFVMPMFILFLAFTVYPLLASVRYTFYDWNGIGVPKDFVGFENYQKISTDPFFWNAFKNTFEYAAVLVPSQLVLALVLAIILNSKWIKARSFFRAVFFSPVVTPPAIIGVVFSLLVNSAGYDLNRTLVNVGLLEKPVDLLGDPRFAMWLVVAVGIWIGLGYPMLYFLAALQAIDLELYDAAKVDGAGNWVLFWHITIPLIRPTGIVVFLITALHALRVFDLIQVMTRGGPYFATDVVGTYIFRKAFFIDGNGDSGSALGYASAAAFLMGILVMGISLLQIAAVRYSARQRKPRGNS